MEKTPMPGEKDKLPSQQAGDSYQHLKSGRAKAAIVGVAWSTMNSLVPLVVSVGVFTITSRYLSPAEFGVVAFAAGIASFASAIAPIGFGEAIVQNTNIEKKHLDSVFWLCVAAAVIIYGGLLLAAWPLSGMSGEEQLAAFIAVIGARVIFDLAATVPNALLTRSMSFDRLALRTTLAAVVSAVVCLTTLAMGYGAWALAISQLSAAMAASVAAFLSVKWKPSLHVDKASLSELKRFGLFASGNRILTTVSVDQVMVGFLLGTTPLGLYGFAQRIHQILSQLIVGVLSSVSFPLLSSLRTEQTKLREVFLSATFVSSAVSFPVFLGLAVVARDLIPFVFGTQWVNAVLPLQAFCVIGLLTSIGVLQSSLIRSQGKVDWWMWYMATNQLLTALTVLISYSFGVGVMVFAIALKTLLYWPVSAVLTAKILQMNTWSYLKIFTVPLAAAILMLLGTSLLHEYLGTQKEIVRLLLEIIFGASIYVCITFYFARDKISNLKSVFKKTRS
jgi:O-antigen/teichoic acid export membrane protein